ncbi:MAG: hypothetical protein MI919_20565 [Holophagales bacterium]|nr:hypothetical protein [Holophagales bacterium]
MIFEAFPTKNEEDFTGLWFLGPSEQRSFEPDEPGDFILKLTGAEVGGTEIQSEDSVLPLARDRIRIWFRFRHPTRTDPLNDTTLGLEHFELDMVGGFLGVDSGTSCFMDCVSAQLGGNQCDDGPPASCTPDLATDLAHFGLLLDLDLNPSAIPKVTSFAGIFADGSACGHLPCSPWEAAFQAQSPDFDPDLWHLLLIEYRPDADVGATFCFDGGELVTDPLSTVLSSLLPALTSSTRTLRLRVSANREAGATEDQRIEVDWFAFHRVPLFGDGLESGNTERWSGTVP